MDLERKIIRFIKSKGGTVKRIDLFNHLKESNKNLKHSNLTNALYRLSNSDSIFYVKRATWTVHKPSFKTDRPKIESIIENKIKSKRFEIKEEHLKLSFEEYLEYKQKEIDNNIKQLNKKIF
mgnify:CR=1 FL=1